MSRPISDFCPFEASEKSCPGTCYDSVFRRRCPHLVEAEINERHYYNNEPMPMWGHLTIVGKETAR